jgi:chromosome segregation ATPase
MVQPTGTLRTPTVRMDDVYQNENGTDFNNVNPNLNPGSNGDFLTVFNSSLKNLQDVVGKNTENSKNLRIGQSNLLQRLGAIALSLKELSDRFPEFSKSMDQQKEYIEGLQADIQKKDQELAESNQQIQELTQEKANLQSEIEQSKTMIEEMKRNSEEEMQKTQQEMDSMKQQYESAQQSGDQRHQEELAHAIQEKQDELQKQQEGHDELLKTHQSNLEKLEQEKSNVSGDLQKLQQENADLKKENDQLIENIKNATMIINNVVNKLQQIADAKDLSPKFQSYYDEIEEYIKLISNALQGASLTTSGGKRLRRRLTKKRKGRGKGRKTKKVRKTKKQRKMRGGFIYKKRRSLKTHKFTTGKFSTRKSSRR